MRFLFKLIESALALLFAAATSINGTKIDPQEATTFALLYGYPLASYVNFSIGIVNNPNCGRFMVNELCPNTKLADDHSQNVVRPNVDTLYTEAMIDLSHSDVEITVPDIPNDRFYVVPFYDLYGNNFENLGTVNASSPGKYLVKYRPSRPGHDTGHGDYKGVIFMPTVYGAIIIRIQVDNTTDVRYVASNIQNHFKIGTINHHIPHAPHFTEKLLVTGIDHNTAEGVLQLTARLSPFNPPEVVSDVRTVAETLRAAGISNGKHIIPAGVNVTKAVIRSKELTLAAGFDPQRSMELGQSWFTTRANASGDFKSDYTQRARIAAYGYLQLVTSEALYPFYAHSDFFSNQSYLVTFSGKPDVKGFWSLTAYTGDEYLVPNTIDRYALGDRSQLRYDDGTLVYGENSSDPNRPFSILLQATDWVPAANWTSNWLPTPATTSQFTEFQFTLRFYGPTGGLTDGSYVYPTVEAIGRV